MMGEFAAAGTDLEIQILGINQIGSEAGNAAITQGRTLPWVQDDDETQVWNAWYVAWRDLVILDQQNARVAVYNLTQHNLSDAGNYAELKAMLLDLAGP